MDKEEVAKRFRKFELCRHRNGEGMCCLYNQDNCIFHRLEKENERLKNRNAELKGMYAHSAREAGTYKQFFEQLKKENAELKEKYKRLDNLEDFTFETYKTFKLDVKELARLFESRGYRLDGAYQENIKLQEQLTKAKDLLLRFIELKNKPCAAGHSVNMLLYENICAEAEQFLKDLEK